MKIRYIPAQNFSYHKDIFLCVNDAIEDFAVIVKGNNEAAEVEWRELVDDLSTLSNGLQEPQYTFDVSLELNSDMCYDLIQSIQDLKSNYLIILQD